MTSRRRDATATFYEYLCDIHSNIQTINTTIFRVRYIFIVIYIYIFIVIYIYIYIERERERERVGVSIHEI